MPKSPGLQIVENVERVVLGKRGTIETAVAPLLGRGHVLPEDVPGLGKTMLARALDRSISADFRRVQCTPDLLTSDVTGTFIFNTRGQAFEFRRGRAFTNLLLRFGGGGRGISADIAVAEIVSARRKSEPRSSRPYQEPGPSMKEWRTRIVALYVRTTRQLAKAGCRRRPSQTTREFARTLAPAGAAGELAQLFGPACYGSSELTEADYERASRASRELLEHPRRLS